VPEFAYAVVGETYAEEQQYARGEGVEAVESEEGLDFARYLEEMEKTQAVVPPFETVAVADADRGKKKKERDDDDRGGPKKRAGKGPKRGVRGEEDEYDY